MYTPYGTELNETERKKMRMKRNLKKGFITGAGILVIVGALAFLANTAFGQGLITGAGILVIVGALAFLANTAFGQRLIKSGISDTTEGLDRTVTVYDYGGNKLKGGKMTLREFLRRQADGAYRSPAKNVQARAGWCAYESDPDTLPEKLKQAARVLSEATDPKLLDGYEASFLEKRWNADDPGSVYTVILLCPIGEGTPLRIVLDHPAYPYKYTLCKQADHHYIFVSDDPVKVMHKAASYLH